MTRGAGWIARAALAVAASDAFVEGLGAADDELSAGALSFAGAGLGFTLESLLPTPIAKTPTAAMIPAVTAAPAAACAPRGRFANLPA